MVQKLKTDLCSLVRGLGYNITDNGAYVEKFPWLMARTGNHIRMDAVNSRVDTVTIIIDIFSTYKGEKEILDIVEDITNHIWEMKTDNPQLTYVAQKDLKILDDNKTGPLKKHGVVTYWFVMSSNTEEESADGSGGD